MVISIKPVLISYTTFDIVFASPTLETTLQSYMDSKMKTKKENTGFIQTKEEPINIKPENDEKIKNAIDEYIRNKEIQIGVIEPLSFFLSLLLYQS